MDEVCLKFSENLYKYLLKGYTVKKAYEEAIKVCKARKTKANNESCCCAHPHKKDCKWLKYANENGVEAAHELHSGKCKCNLGENQHKISCPIYRKFNDEMKKKPPKPQK